ncbi:hypothetical protein RUM44_005740 [Polyplax serrata]|uniref:Uncharacterized protein n=1 Tax=Polyplax serrata TaxID=468196 RepID=A0ABR1AWE6_POLSC
MYKIEDNVDDDMDNDVIGIHHKKIKAERSAHLVQSDEYLPRMSDDYTNPKLLLTLRSCTEEECRLCARCHSTVEGEVKQNVHQTNGNVLFCEHKWSPDPKSSPDDTVKTL